MMSHQTPEGKPPEPPHSKSGGRDTDASGGSHLFKGAKNSQNATGSPRDAVSLTVAICLGIIRDQRVRRSVLFFIMLGVMAMLFAGTALFDRWLEKHVFAFLLYWGACIWFTFLCILMALYDMLMVRKAAAEERRQLAHEMKRDISSHRPEE